ncbi:MAG: SAM-dependent DNA methyltransferase [Alphaproteobacteria bacterium]
MGGVNLGVAMAGGKSAGREENDFYPTPPEVTQAFFGSDEGKLFRENFHGQEVWEPCVGDGAMADIIKGNGHKVIGTDIVDRGWFGTEVQDFLTAKWARAPIIITNPPYNIAQKFIEQADRLGILYMALLLKMTFWNASSRYDLWHRFPPVSIYPLTWRPDFLGKGAPTMDVMWCVWQKGLRKEGTARFQPLNRSR